MKQYSSKIRLKCAHIELTIHKDRKILEGCDMEGHETHRGFITIGWRPSQRCQDEAQQDGQSNDSNGIHPMRANLDPLHNWQHAQKPPVYQAFILGNTSIWAIAQAPNVL